MDFLHNKEQFVQDDCSLGFLADRSQLWSPDIGGLEQMDHLKGNRRLVGTLAICFRHQATIADVEPIFVTALDLS
jgi:hypothetical protein